jgi:8-oxo-dGTP pyrophosphatase MutT (NUDIX family)
MSDDDAPRLDEARVREPLRALLARREVVRAETYAGTPSAVLIPLFERDGAVRVWLLRRSASLRRHAGQVAFPGGRRDAGDASLQETALREAHEEVGLHPSRVDVLGALDALPTITGYVIAPYVGWIDGDDPLVANPSEVERVFSVPLGRFLDKPDGDGWRAGYAVDGENVWGATGALARDLGACVRALIVR